MVLFPQTRLAQEAHLYGIKPLIRSFEDFSIFSRQSLNDTGYYPELITHRSAKQPIEATLDHTRQIRALFRKNWHHLETRYHDTATAPRLRFSKELLSYRYY